MATLSITIPNNQITRVSDALGYKTQIPNPASPGTTMANPESRGDFLKRYATETLRRHARAGEITLAAEAAKLVAETNVATIDIT